MIRRASACFLCLVLLLLLAGEPVRATPDMSYTRDPLHGYRIPIPLAYTVGEVIMDVGKKPLNKASDLFIDSNGLLYVADTGNNRIVKLDPNGRVLGTFGEEQGLKFNKPEGIYVDDTGDMFIADTGNSKIVHLDPKGAKVEEFVRPKTSLMKANANFSPSKVLIDKRGYLNVLDRNDPNGFIMIDANNQFRGYIAANHVPFSWQQLLVRLLATPEQKEQLSKVVPPQHANLTMDEEGYIYSPTVLIDKDQIKKLNALGTNIFKKDTFYGEKSIESGSLALPYFVDIAVDQYGIINALDATSRKIYQYNQEGHLLAVFGGHGNVKGTFEYPSSIGVDRQGRIFVLDRDRNNIQVFEPTQFSELIHQASALYFNGRYEEALKPWHEVLQIDENYPLAHRGVAKALYKQERWEESMAEFKLAGDQEGYSVTFGQYRRAYMKSHFGWVVLIFAIMLYVLYFIVKRLRGFAHKIIRRLGY
jgi:DNA-binding beta-propeller fold protein YncE